MSEYQCEVESRGCTFAIPLRHTCVIVQKKVLYEIDLSGFVGTQKYSGKSCLKDWTDLQYSDLMRMAL